MSLDTCTAVLVLLRHAMASKRKLLTLQDKIKVIQLSEGVLSLQKIADEFNFVVDTTSRLELWVVKGEMFVIKR
jgi:hypothetical protein